ncbi:MAG: GDYXXLXY domain-containing protein [Treponema sp.]|nr:GDYXXLXY domain-containing protein [Treponema sp.]
MAGIFKAWFLDKKIIKILPCAAITIAVTVQLAVIISLLTYTVRVRNYAEKNGRIISLECKAYDPFNPLKGRYVRLTFAENQVSVSNLDDKSRQELKDLSGQKRVYGNYGSLPVYLKMEKSKDGLWTVTGISRKMPSSSDVYISARIPYYYNESIFINYPFDEYYMQENYARYIDKIQWNNAFDDLHPVLSLYVDKKGKCIQQSLTVIDGTERIDIEEYCRRRIKKNCTSD